MGLVKSVSLNHTAWIPGSPLEALPDADAALIVQTIVQHLEECLEIFQRSSPEAEAVLAGGSPAAGRPSPAFPVEAARDLFELLMLVLRASAEAKKKGGADGLDHRPVLETCTRWLQHLYSPAVPRGPFGALHGGILDLVLFSLQNCPAEDASYENLLALLTLLCYGTKSEDRTVGWKSVVGVQILVQSFFRHTLAADEWLKHLAKDLDIYALLDSCRGGAAQVALPIQLPELHDSTASQCVTQNCLSMLVLIAESPQGALLIGRSLKARQHPQILAEMALEFCQHTKLKGSRYEGGKYLVSHQKWCAMLQLVGNMLGSLDLAGPSPLAREIETFLLDAVTALQFELETQVAIDSVPSTASFAEVEAMQLESYVLHRMGTKLRKWEHEVTADVVPLQKAALSILAFAALPALRPRHIIQCRPVTARETALAAAGGPSFKTIRSWFGLVALGSQKLSDGAVTPFKNKKVFVRTPERRARGTLTPLPFSPRSPRSPTNISAEETKKILSHASAFSHRVAWNVLQAAFHALEFLGSTISGGGASTLAGLFDSPTRTQETIKQILAGLQEQCVSISLDANAVIAAEAAAADAGQRAACREARRVSELMGRILNASEALMGLLFGKDAVDAASALQATANILLASLTDAYEDAKAVGAVSGWGPELGKWQIEMDAINNRVNLMTMEGIIPQELASIQAKVKEVVAAILRHSGRAPGAPGAPDGARAFEQGRLEGVKTQRLRLKRKLERIQSILEEPRAAFGG